MTRKNSFRPSAYIFLTIVIVLGLPVRTMGWGNRGHQVIARIAMARLSTSARQAIAQLLEPAESLESVSGWADLKTQPAETRSWHLVAIPLKDSYYAPGKDCARGETCIIQSIERQTLILRDRNNDSRTRAEALKYLVHLIGDLHQPFHVTTNTNPQDRGATLVKVKTLSKRLTNLHEVWDSDLVEHGLKSSKSVNDYSIQLAQKFTNQSKGGSSISTRGSVTDWALEAHKLPWGAYYHSNGDFMVASKEREPWQLDGVYYDKNLPVVELQLVRAGARLAKVLNESLGGAQAR